MISTCVSFGSPAFEPRAGLQQVWAIVLLYLDRSFYRNGSDRAERNLNSSNNRTLKTSFVYWDWKDSSAFKKMWDMEHESLKSVSKCDLVTI